LFTLLRCCCYVVVVTFVGFTHAFTLVGCYVGYPVGLPRLLVTLRLLHGCYVCWLLLLHCCYGCVVVVTLLLLLLHTVVTLVTLVWLVGCCGYVRLVLHFALRLDVLHVTVTFDVYVTVVRYVLLVTLLHGWLRFGYGCWLLGWLGLHTHGYVVVAFAICRSLRWLVARLRLVGYVGWLLPTVVTVAFTVRLRFVTLLRLLRLVTFTVVWFVVSWFSFIFGWLVVTFDLVGCFVVVVVDCCCCCCCCCWCCC